MSPAITFAIPYYKGKEYLFRAIDSVRRQTAHDWELLVCDDSGLDGGLGAEIAGLEDGRIRYHRNETNLGMATNWNRCLSLARADLVCLLHNDDELEPTYARLMLSQSAAYPDATGIFCNATIIDSGGRPTATFADWVKTWLRPNRTAPAILSGEAGVVSLLRGNYIMCPTMCYRRGRIPAEGFAQEWKMVADLEFYLRILMSGGRFVGLPQRAYRYRRHDQNATVIYTRSLQRFEEEVTLYERVAQQTSALGWRRAAEWARGRTVVKLHLAWQVLRSLAGLRFAAAWKAVKFLLNPRPIRDAPAREARDAD